MSVDRIAAEWAARDRNPVAAMTTLPEGFSMTIVPQPWIPVEDRLPEPGETVLVWHHGEVQMAWLNHFTNGVAYFVRDTHYNFEPTHWMPLPEPPAP